MALSCLRDFGRCIQTCAVGVYWGIRTCAGGIYWGISTCLGGIKACCDPYIESVYSPKTDYNEQSPLSSEHYSQHDDAPLQRYERSFEDLRNCHTVIRSTYLDQNKQHSTLEEKDENLDDALGALGNLVDSSRAFIHIMEKNYQESKSYWQGGCEKIRCQEALLSRQARAWTDQYRPLLQKHHLTLLPTWDDYFQPSIQVGSGFSHGKELL